MEKELRVIFSVSYLSKEVVGEIYFSFRATIQPFLKPR